MSKINRATQPDIQQMLAVTPLAHFSLGATNTYVPVQFYYETILPLFVDQRPDEYGRIRIRKKQFLLLLRGGVLDSNQTMGQSVNTGTYYVRDSELTRQRLTDMGALPLSTLRRAYLENCLLMISCAQAWLIIVRALTSLQRKLSMTGWPCMLDKRNSIDLVKWVKIGRLTDEGLLPVTLLRTAIRLSTARMLDWMKNQHPSQGIWNGRAIRFVYASQLSLTHLNGSAMQFLWVSAGIHSTIYPNIKVKVVSRHGKQK